MVKIQRPLNGPNFDYNVSYIEAEDRSSMVASISSLNGCINGSSGVYGPDMDNITENFEMKGSASGRDTWLSHGW